VGIRLEQTGQVDEAIVAYREAIRFKNDYAQAHNNLGLAQSRKGQRDAAIASFREALRHKPEYPRALINPGKELLSNGRPDEAVAPLQTAVRLNERDVEAHDSLGRTFQKLGQWDEAQAAFVNALRRGPDNPAVLNNVAWFRATCPEAKFRDAAEAVRLAQKATRLRPKMGICWSTLGEAHYRSGQWAEAVAALDKSVQLRRGGTATDWFFLAMAHRQLGHPDEADQYYRKAVRWMDEHQPKDKDLRRFRAEAAALFEIADGPQPRAKDAPLPKR
jgi:tetratricopeptide (TPR) repeat protein